MLFFLNSFIPPYQLHDHLLLAIDMCIILAYQIYGNGQISHIIPPHSFFTSLLSYLPYYHIHSHIFDMRGMDMIYYHNISDNNQI